MSKPRTKKKPPVWTAVAAANSPDPRVSPDNAEYGKRTVLTVFAIDSLGRLCRLPAALDGGDPVILATPPAVNEDGG